MTVGRVVAGPLLRWVIRARARRRPAAPLGDSGRPTLCQSTAPRRGLRAVSRNTCQPRSYARHRGHPRAAVAGGGPRLDRPGGCVSNRPGGATGVSRIAGYKGAARLHGCSSAARRFEPLDAELARETHLEALGAALWVGDLDSPGRVREAAEAARAAPPGPDPPRAVDVLLDAFAMRLTEGYAPAAPTLTRALELVLALDVGTDGVGRWLWLAGASSEVALELWDAEASPALALAWHSSPATPARWRSCSSRSTPSPEPIFSPASCPRRR